MKEIKKSFADVIAKRLPTKDSVVVVWGDDDRYTCSWDEFETAANHLPYQLSPSTDPYSSLRFVGEGGKWWLQWRCCEDTYYSDWVLCRTPNIDKPHRAPTSENIKADMP